MKSLRFLLSAIISIFISGALYAQDTGNRINNIVLVHGAWVDGSGWKGVFDILTKKGYNVGKIDGIIGELTREAVKDVQLKLGLPADSYPTQELLAKLS
jgi:hypothetical protein